MNAFILYFSLLFNMEFERVWSLTLYSYSEQNAEHNIGTNSNFLRKKYCDFSLGTVFIDIAWAAKSSQGANRPKISAYRNQTLHSIKHDLLTWSTTDLSIRNLVSSM